MKICIIVDDYMPNSIKVAAKMMHELAIELNKKSHSITVITPNPNIKNNTDIIELDSIKIIRFKSGTIKNVSKVKRAINETLLSYKAWKYCKNHLKENKHDLIIYYSPSIFFGNFINKLKKLWDAPSYLILRDIFPQWVIDNGLLKETSPITKYFKFFESINYKSADKIGLMSEENLKWFNKKYNNTYDTELLYNWASNDINKLRGNYRESLDIKDKIIYFYGGNMGHAQDMMNLLKLAKKMKAYEKAHFLFVGEGDEVNLMKNFIKKENLTNTTLLPSVNQLEFKKILSEIDIGLFTLNYNHKTHNFPGKLLGYMCESKAILGSVNPGNDLKKIIESENAGYITITGEDDLLFQNALKLLDQNHSKKLGKNGNNLLNSQFSVSSAALKILNIVE